jgi:hypothetical protein
MSRKKELMRQVRYMVKHRRMKEATDLFNQLAQLSDISKLVHDIYGLGARITILRQHPAGESLMITQHALERTSTYRKMLGKSHDIDHNKMRAWLSGGTVIDYSDVIALGYRPRHEHADRSTYVQLQDELVAVLTENENTIAWVTTLSTVRTPNHLIPISEKEYRKLKPKKRKRRR